MKVVWSIASTTFGEAVRRKVLLVILLIGVLLISIIPALSILSARSDKSIATGTMFAVMRGTSALIAIILTIYMIPNEIERRTIYTILSKPVQRWQFLVGKYLGAAFSLLVMIGLMTVLMTAMFVLFQHPTTAEVASIIKQPFMYWIEMCLLASVAMFFSTFVAPLVNFFLSIGMWLVGTVLNPLYDTVSKNSQTPAFMKGLAKFITSLLPNFASYDTKNPIINPGQAIQNESQYYVGAIVYGAFYICILLILGILVFDKREV